MTKEEQLEYMGVTEESWTPVESYSGPIPYGYELRPGTYINPFTGEEYIRDTLFPLPSSYKEMQLERLMSLESLDSIDVSGIEISDKEIGDIIIARVFNGNPHAESALTAKVIDILLKQRVGTDLEEKDFSILQEAENIRIRVNEIRQKFKIAKI